MTSNTTGASVPENNNANKSESQNNGFWPTKWWSLFDKYKIGIIPLPIFILAGLLIYIGVYMSIDSANIATAASHATGKIVKAKFNFFKKPSDLVIMGAVVCFFGFACAEIGRRLPIVGKMGAAAICATFIPSVLVYFSKLAANPVGTTEQLAQQAAAKAAHHAAPVVNHVTPVVSKVAEHVAKHLDFVTPLTHHVAVIVNAILPEQIIKATETFYKTSNILYIYIACIIVGSIMSMDRKTLIQGFLRIFVPMICGEIVGMCVGTLVGVLLGMGATHTFFYVILPIMAGGVGEGAIPLSTGYAHIFGTTQPGEFGQIIPIVMLGSLTAIILAGQLNNFGKRKTHLTGEGKLMPGVQDSTAPLQKPTTMLIDPSSLLSGGLLAMLFYILGVLGQHATGLPAPVIMLFLAVIFKLVDGASQRLLDSSHVVYKFFQTSVTFPVLFAVGVATKWEDLMKAFTIPNIIVIVCTVCSLVATGFFVGKLLKMYPIDVAIVSCCQSGQGGTGDVAILTAGNRMELMPFAQIATRIGGAINVSLGLIILTHFHTFFFG